MFQRHYCEGETIKDNIMVGSIFKVIKLCVLKDYIHTLINNYTKLDTVLSVCLYLALSRYASLFTFVVIHYRSAETVFYL